MRRLPLLALPFALALVLAPGQAHAQAPDDPVQTDRFDPSLQIDLLGFEGSEYDSDWIPADSPLQLRIEAEFANSIYIEMLGLGVYDWEDETIHFEGDPEGGWFAYDIGIFLNARVRFNALGQNLETDILGPYDYLIDPELVYTPYLLDGHEEDPLVMMDVTEPFTLVSVPIFPDIIIASGNLDINLSAEVDATLSGVRIENTTQEANTATNTVHAQAEALIADPGDEDLDVHGRMFVQLDTSPTVVLEPTVVFSIFGQDYEIANLPIPIDLPTISDELELEPQDMTFPRWDPPEPPGDGDGDGDGDGGSDGGGDSGGDDVGDGETGGTGDTGDTGDFGVDDAEGCSCSADADAGVGSSLGWASIALFGLFGLRRRRRED